MSSSRRNTAFLILAVGIAAAPHSATASDAVNTIVVTTQVDTLDGEDGICSLREALRNTTTNAQYSALAGECPAGSGAMTDVIVLTSAATYSLQIAGDDGGDLDVGNDPLLPVDITDLRFETTSAAKATLRQTVPKQRVMSIDTNARIEIDNLVLRDGDADTERGGGIFTKGGQVVLTRSTFTANTAAVGGAIAVLGGRLDVQDGLFLFNTAANAGGAASLEDTIGVFRYTVLQGNAAALGGAVYASKSQLAFLDDSLVRSNQASTWDGGGVFAEQSAVFAQHSTFEQNTATNDGGAISVSSGSLHLEYAEFIGNEAIFGGAIDANIVQPVSVTGGRFADNISLVTGLGGGAIIADSVVIDGTRFENNSALDPSASGGAILANQVTASRCEFIGNTAGNSGGAIDAGQQVQLESCRLADNKAGQTGGALRLVSMPGYSNRIRNSVFSGNVSTFEGGALWIKSLDSAAITNTTFSGNLLTDEDFGTGSAIYLAEDGQVDATNVTMVGEGTVPMLAKWGTLRLQNSLLSSPAGDDCVMSPMDPLILSLGNNLAEDSTCFGLDQPGDMAGTDAQLAPLADNGGSTLTHALLEGSPAIDAGNGIACQAAPVDGVDQRGVSRTAGLNCDIGAYEYTAPPPDLPVELFADEFED